MSLYITYSEAPCGANPPIQHLITFSLVHSEFLPTYLPQLGTLPACLQSMHSATTTTSPGR